MTRLRTCCALLAAGFILALLPWASTLGSEPLTTEDVVRRFVSGSSTDELVTLIGSREGDYDLHPEMVTELRYAGVPERLIEAMRQRMADQARATGEPVPGERRPAEAAPGANLRIRLNSDRREGKPEVLRIAEPVGFELLATLELRETPENASFTDLAIFLADTTAIHVPDHWRSKSVLGRDFVSMPRHKLLAFISGAERTGKQGGPGTLELEIPEEIEVDLEPGASHDLMLGVALQVGGRYYRFVHDARQDIVVEDELVLEAKVASGFSDGATRLTARFIRGFEPSGEPDED